MALSLYSLVSSPPDKDRVFGNDVFVLGIIHALGQAGESASGGSFPL